MTCESMAVTMSPRSSAPQPLRGMREQIGADVLSQIYASFSLLTPFLSQRGLATVPATSAVMDDSINITIPTK